MTAQHHQAADAALRQGQVREAIGCLERAVADRADDFEAWMKLAALRRRNADLPGALEAANTALDLRPNEFLALLTKGSLHERLGETGRAAEVYRAAVYFAAEVGTLPPPVATQVDHAKAFLAGHRAEIQSAMTVLGGLDGEHRDRATRFLDNALDRRPVYHQEPTHYRYPGLPDIEFFDHAYGALCERLRQAWTDIRDEYLTLAALHAERKRPYVDFAPGQPVGQWAALNRSPDWNVFHLIRYGETDPVNAAACPRTLEAMAGDFQVDAPGITPNLMFSLLAPHTRIPPHHGVANFRAVLHLPLIVPADCHFRVGGETRQWIEGEPWIFDDTIEHEAWNDSDTLRVVMIGDLWRPELDSEDRRIIRDFIAAQASDNTIGAL